MSVYQALVNALLGDRVDRVAVTARELPSVSGIWCPANGPAIEELLDQNSDFRGREEVIEAVHAILIRQWDDRPSSCVLWGMAGVGKSSIALEYAYRYANRYRILKWISAELAPQILSDLADLAERLGVPREQDIERMVSALWTVLHDQTDWLLVFDNVEDGDRLADLVPAASLRGHILVTSRQKIGSRTDNLIRVTKMAPAEAVDFLLARTFSDDRESAGQIAARLDCLPLALDQAATFVLSTQRDLAFYLDLLGDALAELFELPGPRGHPMAVSATLSVSLKSISGIRPGIEGLLRLFAMLAPDDIPRDVIAANTGVLPESLADVAASRFAFEWSVAQLDKFSLVALQGDRIDVHRLVQFVVRAEMGPEGERDWLSAAVRLLAAAFPVDVRAYDRWGICDRLVPHVIFAADHEHRLGAGPGSTMKPRRPWASYCTGPANTSWCAGSTTKPPT